MKLFAKHLPVEIRAKSIKSIVSRQIEMKPAVRIHRPHGGTSDGIEKIPTFREYRKRQLDKIEREYLLKLIAKAKGDYKEARRVSSLARTRLYELLKKHGLSIKH